MNGASGVFHLLQVHRLNASVELMCKLLFGPRTASNIQLNLNPLKLGWKEWMGVLCHYC
jgi:hypothetical protein